MAGHFAQFDFTPQVVRAHIPVLNIGGEQFMDLCCVNRGNGRLFLRLVQDTSSRRPGMYGSKTRVGGYRLRDSSPSFRCVELCTTEYRSHEPSWLDIYFMNTTPSEHHQEKPHFLYIPKLGMSWSLCGLRRIMADQMVYSVDTYMLMVSTLPCGSD